ncbi:hypothetical protein ACX3PU_08785 [Chryseobacterium sp. A301]
MSSTTSSICGFSASILAKQGGGNTENLRLFTENNYKEISVKMA